jgi:peroxiredoxin
MLKTLKYIKENRSWQRKYDATAPKPGDNAPDFELYDTHGNNPTKLSDFRGKTPVVLVFGSYT